MSLCSMCYIVTLSVICIIFDVFLSLVFLKLKNVDCNYSTYCDLRVESEGSVCTSSENPGLYWMKLAICNT